MDFSSDSSKDNLLDVKNDQLTYISYRYLRAVGKLKEYESGTKLIELIDVDELNDIFVEVKNKADQYHTKCISDLDDMIDKLNIAKDDINYSCIVFLLNKLKDRTK